MYVDIDYQNHQWSKCAFIFIDRSQPALAISHGAKHAPTPPQNHLSSSPNQITDCLLLTLCWPTLATHLCPCRWDIAPVHVGNDAPMAEPRSHLTRSTLGMSVLSRSSGAVRMEDGRARGGGSSQARGDGSNAFCTMQSFMLFVLRLHFLKL